MNYLRFILLCLVSTLLQAASVIELYYHEGNEVAASLRPLLQSGESVSALENKLILQASPERVVALTQIVKQLDQKPQSLRIEVAQNTSDTSRGGEIGASGRIGSVNIDQNGARTSSRTETRFGVFGNAQSNQSSSSSQQVLRILSGGEGQIQTGLSRPINYAFIDPNGNIQYGNSFQDAITGFRIRPRVVGNNVIIDVTAGTSRFEGENTRNMNASTRVQGQLNQWIEVAHVGENAQGQSIMFLGASRGQSSRSGSIRIKVGLD